MYIYERKDWPSFHWNEKMVSPLLGDLRHMQGRLIGQMEAIGFELREEATLQAISQDVIKSCEIEGENLNAGQVRSSIARRLGMEVKAKEKTDRHVDGIVEMMLDATQNYAMPLTERRLFAWHAALFPMPTKSGARMVVGKWRDAKSGPMQIVSGPAGREKVHFEAPGHSHLKSEMSRFIKWINTGDSVDPVIQSAIAHFWFVTIHPFDDGNGRIARAIGDMMLARSEKTSRRFYSMSSQIRAERNEYYERLERSQKGNVDITDWLEWYLGCLQRAIASSEQLLQAVLGKARFWQSHAEVQINDRQRLMLNRLLDGFDGKLTSSKWATIAKCSQDTALRDITDLLDRKILSKDDAGGRSTSYLIGGLN